MKRTILIALLLLATAACDDSAVREAAEEAGRSYAARAIDDERGRINGLSIGSSEAEVRAAFGPPAKVRTGFSEVEGKPSRTLLYDGIEVYLIDNEIFDLECRAQRCVTHDGIRLGDSAEKILAIFKKGEPEERDDGTVALRYPLGGADIALIIVLKDDKVVELKLWFNYV